MGYETAHSFAASDHLTELESEIAELINDGIGENPVPIIGPPSYVEHRDGVNEIGKLSAEAVIKEYESAAKEIESMGAMLIERVKQCEAMTRDAMNVAGEMRDTAAKYRAEAKRVFEQIEACTLLTDEVRKTCIDLQSKIGSNANGSG